MLPYRAALFDIDGTVQNTSEFIHSAFEHVFKSLNIEGITRADINPLIGLPLQEIYARFVPNEDFARLRDMHNDYQSRNLQLIENYQDIETVLSALKQNSIKIAAVSSRKRESLEESLTHSEIIQYFDIIVGPYDTPHHKPHPAPAIFALARMEIQPNEAIMIGDSYIDIETGKNAGTATMRAMYGFNQERPDEPAPDYVAHAPADILAILLPTTRSSIL